MTSEKFTKIVVVVVVVVGGGGGGGEERGKIFWRYLSSSLNCSIFSVLPTYAK